MALELSSGNFFISQHSWPVPEFVKISDDLFMYLGDFGLRRMVGGKELITETSDFEELLP